MKLILKSASVFALSLASYAANAGDDGGKVIDSLLEADKASICDLFDYATLYKSDTNPVLQKLSYTGRLQADAVFFEGDQGDYDSLEWRRVRSGFKAEVFDNFTIHSEIDLDLNDRSPAYNGLTDSYIGWSNSKAFVLKVGKQGALFTGDGAISSKNLITTERSLLSTNVWFPREYFTGVNVNGAVDKWVYNAGFFSSDGELEFSRFDAGYFGLASIGYDFSDTFGIDKALIRADYVNNDPSGNGNLGTRNLTQIGSLNGDFKMGNCGLYTDIAAAEGDGSQSDIFGLSITPYYDLTDKVQLVTRYNYVNSSGDNGVRLDRYESRIESGRADEVHEFYAGVNYYICGHKLKLQTGVQYTTANDDANDGGEYDGWGVSTGFRMSW